MWSFPPSWRDVVFALLLALATSASATERDKPPSLPEDPMLDLATVVDAALARHPDGLALNAWQREADALRGIADSMLAAPAALQLRHQRDLPGQHRGLYEHELGLNLPIKLPGRRAHERELADLAARTAQLLPAALRWRVAGLVRESLWEVALARNTAAFSNAEVHEAEEIRSAVAIRVDAGDLPRVDGVLAAATVAEKLVERSQSYGQLDAALARYRLLTGLDRLPAQQYEAVTDSEIALTAKHPALAAASALSARRAAEVRVNADRAVTPPSLQFGPRRERGARGDDWENTFGFSLSIPVGGAAQREAAAAASARELGDAMASEASLLRAAESALAASRASYHAAQLAVVQAAKRRELAEQHLLITRTGFDAGELDLQDLLKAHAYTHSARLDAERWVLLEGLELARLRQAQGDPLLSDDSASNESGLSQRKLPAAVTAPTVKGIE